MDPNIFRPLQARGQASTNIDGIDEDSQNRKVLEAYAAVAKLAVLEPDDAQLAKAFIPPMRKRQASKVTVTTTTTVPPVCRQFFIFPKRKVANLHRLPMLRP